MHARFATLLSPRKGTLTHLPKALKTTAVYLSKPDLNLSIAIRGEQEKVRGKFGDGIIGAQAIENNLPLITNDRRLKKVMNKLKPGLVR